MGGRGDRGRRIGGAKGGERGGCEQREELIRGSYRNEERGREEKDSR